MPRSGNAYTRTGESLILATTASKARRTHRQLEVVLRVLCKTLVQVRVQALSPLHDSTSPESARQDLQPPFAAPGVEGAAMLERSCHVPPITYYDRIKLSAIRVSTPESMFMGRLTGGLEVSHG
jgi:hypothetical protein